MIEFRSIHLVLIAIIAFVAWSLDYYNFFKRPQIFLPSTFFQKGLNSINLKRHFLYLIGLIAWVLIGIALAGPRIPQSFANHKIKINDLYFVVDVSRSMLSEDFAPNRIEVAKKNILNFIKLRPTDRIGIITFAREVFTLMPLTTDLDLIEQLVASINVGLLGSATNIGDALGLGVARLMRTESKSKVIILMTDGVSNAGNLEPREAAKAAAKNGIRTYTIGIGSSKGGKLPLANSPFGKRYQKIPGGSIDLELLQDIAKITKAKSYLAENEETLKDILNEINSLEKTEIKIAGQVIYDEIYLKYLITGILVLILIEILRKKMIREVA